MFSSRAAALYEALSAVLGLEEFDLILATLRDARLACERGGKDEKQARRGLRQRLEASDDDRASAVAEMLARRQPDMKIVLDAAGESGAPVAGSLVALSSLEIPSADAIMDGFGVIDRAAERVAELALGDTARLEALAGLFETGLAFHRAHGDAEPADCPLCGAEQRLDAAWTERVSAEIAELRGRSHDLRAARSERANVLRAAREQLFSAATGTALLEAASAGLELNAPSGAWQDWIEAFREDDATFQAQGAELAKRLRDQLEHARKLAADDRRRREDAWRPLHDAIGEWAVLARRAERELKLVGTLKAA
jgi:hypothetical protein